MGNVLASGPSDAKATIVLAEARNKQIAHHLGIAEHTVKIHRGRVMKKLRVATVTELVNACQQAGIEPTTAP